MTEKLVMIGIRRKGESSFKIKTGVNHGNIYCDNNVGNNHCDDLGIRYGNYSRSGGSDSDIPPKREENR